MQEAYCSVLDSFTNRAMKQVRYTLCSYLSPSSSTKFDSGSGWPSFYAPLQDHPDEANEKMTEFSVPVTQKEDHSHGMNRVEVLCKEVSCDHMITLVH